MSTSFIVTSGTGKVMSLRIICPSSRLSASQTLFDAVFHGNWKIVQITAVCQRVQIIRDPQDLASLRFAFATD